MPKWEDSRITESVNGELDDLKAVLAIISQLSKPVALRVLRYCASFVEDGSSADALPPGFDAETIKQKFAQYLAAQQK